MTEHLDLTIAICTHNRADLLPKAIDSVIGQAAARQSAEIIIVDNASTDKTKTVAKDYENRFSKLIRYVHESQLGIARARNRAIKEARGRHILFLDDDAHASADWVDWHQKAWESGYRAVVGPVELDWKMERPEWVTAEIETLFARYDFGGADLDLPVNGYLITTNASFEKKLMDELGGFNELLGHRGRCLVGGEDNELFSRLCRSGIAVRYIARALVFHAVLPERVNLFWVIKRIFWDGMGITNLNFQGKSPGIKWVCFEAMESLRFCLKALFHSGEKWHYWYPALQYAGMCWANFKNLLNGKK